MLVSVILHGLIRLGNLGFNLISHIQPFVVAVVVVLFCLFLFCLFVVVVVFVVVLFLFISIFVDMNFFTCKRS